MNSATLLALERSLIMETLTMVALNWKSKMPVTGLSAVLFCCSLKRLIEMTDDMSIGLHDHRGCQWWV